MVEHLRWPDGVADPPEAEISSSIESSVGSSMPRMSRLGDLPQLESG
jgi:hypothetical protein